MYMYRYIYSAPPYQRDVNDEHLACTQASLLSLSFSLSDVYTQVRIKNHRKLGFYDIIVGKRIGKNFILDY